MSNEWNFRSQQGRSSGSQQQNNIQQPDQIMIALNGIRQAQEAMRNDLNGIRQAQEAMRNDLNEERSIQSLHRTPRQQHVNLNFTYEMFNHYLTERLAPQLEERARSLAPVLLELRYFFSIVITPINDHMKLTYPLDLFVRWLKITMGFLAFSISVRL